MNRQAAEKIADAVLYEGYMLYPYRPSAIKNRQRWSFGILYPPAYGEVRSGTERSAMHSECLLKSDGSTTVQIQLRFLHLQAWEVAQSSENQTQPPGSLVVDDQLIESWDEGIARSVEVDVALSAASLQCVEFTFPSSYQTEPRRDSAGQACGMLTHTQHEVRGVVSVISEAIRENVLKLTIDSANQTALPSDALDRSSSLLRSLLSAHTILTVSDGEFVSLLDPPEDLRATAAGCRNEGSFPVLVGEAGARDMLLCSPIILYDYPQIAPESAGDFYDATEMDEMLTLRVMTLPDQEKNEMRLADDRIGELLRRTEQSAQAQLMRTHGTIRSLRPVRGKP